MTAFASPARVPLPALVGREREQAMLRDCFAAACDGRGGLVLIGGAAGIGKTALAEALCREAADQAALVLVGRCYDLTETPPYGPWVELFSQYRSSDVPPLPDAFARRGTVGVVTSQAALFQEGLDFCRAVAAERPMLLLLDDFHWADLASLDLLRFLARSLAALRVLLVVIYRADELTRRHPLYTLLPLLVREASATRIDVRPLTPGDITALVRLRYHLLATDAAQLVAYLNDRSEGNPFFLGELLRTLEEEGMLQQTDRGWSLGALAGVQVPLLLRQVIDGRLMRLGDDAQALLTVAAVIGQDVPFDVWGAVTKADDVTLLDAVEQATVAHLVEATADGVDFHFVHALIREALHESILPPRRRILHRQIGDVLAATPTADPDAVAYHFQHANDDRALPWLVRAGERAQAAYAWATAAQRFEAALALTSIGDPATRGWLLVSIAHLRRHAGDPRILAYLEEAAALAEQAGDRLLAAWALFARGFIHSVVGHGIVAMQDTEAGALALVALTPAERTRYPPGRPWIPVEPHEVPVGSVILLAAVYGRFAHALTLAHEWMGPYQSDEGVVEARWRDGWGGLAIAYAAQGRPTEAHAAYERAHRGARVMGHYFYLGATLHNLLVDVVLPYETERTAERAELTSAAMDALVLGREVVEYDATWVTVPERYVSGAWDDAAFLGERGQHRLHLMTMQAYVGQWHRARGKADAAWGCVRWGLPEGAGTTLGDAPYAAMPLALLAANLALDAGDLQTAQEWLEAHQRWLAWSGGVRGKSEGQALWARYYRQAGESAQAYACARSALARATSPRQPLALITAHRLLGELDTKAGRYDEAASHLDESLRLADACAAPYERALTLLALAELRATTGDEVAARVALDEVRAICTPLGAKPALALADALTARLSVKPARTSQHPGGLSAREVEVLRLVAQGMTDAQVAEQLYLSPRTVGQHLRNIYNKLGVSTRNAAARFAIEHHLT